MNKTHWQAWLVAIIGVWLVASNWVLSYAAPGSAGVTSDAAIFWNAIFTGVAAILLGGLALAAFEVWEEWATLTLGLWLVASPWMIGFVDNPIAMWNVVTCGVIVIFSAVSTLYDAGRAGHA